MTQVQRTNRVYQVSSMAGWYRKFIPTRVGRAPGAPGPRDPIRSARLCLWYVLSRILRKQLLLGRVQRLRRLAQPLNHGGKFIESRFDGFLLGRPGLPETTVHRLQVLNVILDLPRALPSPLDAMPVLIAATARGDILLRGRVIDAFRPILHAVPADGVHFVAFHFPSPAGVAAIAGSVSRDLATGGFSTGGLSGARLGRNCLDSRFVCETDWGIIGEPVRRAAGCLAGVHGPFSFSFGVAGVFGMRFIETAAICIGPLVRSGAAQKTFIP